MQLTHKVKNGFGHANWRPKPAPFTPNAFMERLEEVFGSTLRIRWSVVQGAWQIEQKVARASFAPLGRNAFRDDVIRAREGYDLVMVVQAGPEMHCPICDTPVQAPKLETAEVTCKACRRAHSDARIMGGWFPLGEVLIEHLKKCDPERVDQRRRVAAESDSAWHLKQLLEASQRREIAAQYGDALRDQMPKAGFPSLTLDAWRH